MLLQVKVYRVFSSCGVYPDFALEYQSHPNKVNTASKPLTFSLDSNKESGDYATLLVLYQKGSGQG